MEKNYEDDDNKSQTAKFLGFGFAGLSAFAILITIIVAWWYRIGIRWNWYLYLMMPFIFILQIVFTFVLPEKGKFIQPSLFILLLLNIILVFWFATYTVFVLGSLSEYKHELKKWPKENKVYVFLNNKKQNSTTTEISDPSEFIKNVIAKIKATTEAQKTGVQGYSKYMQILSDIKLKPEAVKKAVEAIKNIFFAWHLKAAFVEISLVGVNEVAKDDSHIMKETDFNILFSKKTGKDHIKADN